MRRRHAVSRGEELRVSDRSWAAAVALACLGGWAGLHRLYIGRTVTGIFLSAVSVSAFGCALMSPAVQQRFGGAGFWKWYLGFVLVCGAADVFITFFGADFLFAFRFALPGRGGTGFCRAGAGRRAPLPGWCNGSMCAVLAVLVFLAGMAAAAVTGRTALLTLAWAAAGAALTGIAWTKDVKALFRGSLTDGAGRPVMRWE